MASHFALFVDLENCGGKKSMLMDVIERVKIRGDILIGKVYGYTDSYSDLKEILLSNTFAVVPSLRFGRNQKNSLDIQLVIDALDVAYTNSLIDSFCIVSGDSDYVPLVGKLKTMGKFVLGISRSEAASGVFMNACSEFQFLESVASGKERAQDVEWQKENGENWLYIHYIVTRSGTTVGRGLRYVTVHNGLYVELDWRIESGRFSGRDLNAFRARLADIAITESVAEPVRDVKLDAEIPTETSVGQVTISGTATAGATVIAETPDGNGAMLTLDAETVSSSGQFTLALELEKEGSYEITLTASKEGMNDASLSGAIAYSAKTLPVSGIAESQTVTSDKVTITGTTLAGVQLQLVTPFGVSKKKSGNDGTFSFELTTDTAGDYKYTLILDKSGYNQRRVAFAITRVTTDEQEKDKIRQSAVKLSYKELQQDKAENRGKVMRLYGPVSEISSSGSIYYVRLQYNKNAKGKWYNDVVIICDADTGAKVGDMMTAVVTVDGVYDEQDASGNDVAVPRFNLLFVDKIE